MSLKVCIIGASGHYGYVLEVLGEEFEIVGISPGVLSEDISTLLSRLENFSLKPRVYENHAEMLKLEKPDLVVINTHFHMNDRILQEVLQMGIHAFAEKPIATDLKDLERIEKLHSMSKGTHFVAIFGLRYKAWFLTTKCLVESSAIGEIRLMNAQKSYKLGERPAFFKKRETFGDTLAWVGIHTIDWIHWISNKRFASVYALHSRMMNRGYGELKIMGTRLFELEQEIIATVSVDYLRSDTAETRDDDRLKIVGTKGILEVAERKVKIIDENGTRFVQTIEKGNIFKDFLNCVYDRNECMVTEQQSIYVTYIALKAMEAADSRTLIRF